MCIVVHTDVNVLVELTSLTTEMSEGTETLGEKVHAFIPTTRNNFVNLFSFLFLKRLNLSCNKPLLFVHLPTSPNR